MRDSLENYFKTSESRVYLYNPKEYVTVYKTLYEELRIYAEKLSPSISSKLVRYVLENKIVYLAKSQGISIPVFSCILHENNKIRGILINVGEVPINLETGQSYDISKTYYAVYNAIVRILAVYFHSKPGDKLDDVVLPYYKAICLYCLLKAVPETDKTVDLLDSVITFNYYIKYYHLMPSSALKQLSADKQKLVENNLLAQKPTGDMLKSLPICVSLALPVQVTPGQIHSLLIKELGVRGHLYLFSMFDTMVSYLVQGDKGRFFKTLDIFDEQKAKKIEEVLCPVYKKVPLQPYV